MTGLFVKKFHVAVLDSDQGTFNGAVSSLKAICNHKVVVKTFSNSRALFQAINLEQATNHPFDMAVVSPNQLAEKMVLKQSNPDLRVVVCKDAQTLRDETLKLLL